jgi:CheY-like chemotaxis protein
LALLDLHHPGRDGLSMCFRITRRSDAPAVVLYSSHTDDATVVAGAGAVVGTSSSTETAARPERRRLPIAGIG